METREVQDKRRTASFAASAEGTKVVFSENYKYYHFRNDGGGTVYVSAYSDVGEGVDGTKSIADGGCGYVFSCDDHVFVKGAAKITVEASNLPECPFKSAQRGGDITAKGNPVQIDGLQGGVPFSEIAVSGKNLLKYPYYNTTKTISGITFTDNGDGTITANGTATATASYFLDSEFNYIGGITYTISGCPKGGSNSTYKIKGDRLGAYIDDNGNGATYSFKYDTTAAIVILIYKDTTVDNIVFRPQLKLGSTPTEYEPPITGRDLTVNVNGTDYTITPDSNPYIVPNDIRQQDGLNNISVSAGTLSVTGVRKNAAIKRIWDEIDEIKTAIIVSNGESE